MHFADTILVHFSSTEKEYAYWCDIEVDVDDLVVVPVQSGGFKIAIVSKIVGITQSKAQKAHKWVASKIDLTEYYAKVERQNKIYEIKNRLKKRKEQLEDIYIYQELAKTDDQISNLLKELVNLDANVPKLTDK